MCDVLACNKLLGLQFDLSIIEGRAAAPRIHTHTHINQSLTCTHFLLLYWQIRLDLRVLEKGSFIIFYHLSSFWFTNLMSLKTGLFCILRSSETWLKEGSETIVRKEYRSYEILKAPVLIRWLSFLFFQSFKSPLSLSDFLYNCMCVWRLNRWCSRQLYVCVTNHVRLNRWSSAMLFHLFIVWPVHPCPLRHLVRACLIVLVKSKNRPDGTY